MKKTLLFLTFGFLVCCKSIQTPLYFSTCTLYGKPDLRLELKSDSSFQYNFRYNDEPIIGKWTLKSDTLILVSDEFCKPRNELSLQVKNSNLKGIDKYLVKGRKLFIIDSIGLKKECYLKK